MFSSIAALPERVSLDGVTLPLKVSRHYNARRMTLRYDALRRLVRLTLPVRASVRIALDFLREREAWLVEQMQRHPQPVPFVDGAEIPVLGKMLTLCHREALRGQIECVSGKLIVPAPAEHLNRRVTDWLKKRAREEILKEATFMASRLGVTFQRLSVRDTASRWGSCSTAGNLSFCWRLVFAPRPILSYLIAHEIAHLKEMNHSPAFWREVGLLYPDYLSARKWLSRHASELHRYGG